MSNLTDNELFLIVLAGAVLAIFGLVVGLLIAEWLRYWQ